MKHATQHYVILILSFLAFVIILFSCSMQHHEKKYIQKGGTFECDTVYQDVVKTIKGKDGKDSLIYVPTPIPCPPCEPKTRYQTRWKYKYDLKRQKARDNFLIDSLSKVNKRAQIEGNTQIKQSKQETKQIKQVETTKKKTAFPWEWLFGLIALVIGAVIFLIHKFKN